MFKIPTRVSRFAAKLLVKNDRWIREFELAIITKFWLDLSEQNKRVFLLQLKSIDVIDRSKPPGKIVFFSDSLHSATYSDWPDEIRLNLEGPSFEQFAIKHNEYVYSISGPGIETKAELLFVNGGLRCLAVENLQKEYGNEVVDISDLNEALPRSMKLLDSYGIDLIGVKDGPDSISTIFEKNV